MAVGCSSKQLLEAEDLPAYQIDHTVLRQLEHRCLEPLVEPQACSLEISDPTPGVHPMVSLDFDRLVFQSGGLG